MRIPSRTFLISSLPSWGSLYLMSFFSLMSPFFISYHFYTFLRTWYNLYTLLPMIHSCTRMLLLLYSSRPSFQFSFFWILGTSKHNTGIIALQVSIIPIKMAFYHGNSIQIHTNTNFVVSYFPCYPSQASLPARTTGSFATRFSELVTTATVLSPPSNRYD